MTLDEAFVRLGKSKFRSRFTLTAADREYIARVGMETIRRHAADFGTGGDPVTRFYPLA